MRKYACDCSEAMLVFIEKAMSILLKDGRPAHVGMVRVRGFAIGFISSRQGTPGFEPVACSTFALHIAPAASAVTKSCRATRFRYLAKRGKGVSKLAQGW